MGIPELGRRRPAGNPKGRRPAVRSGYRWRPRAPGASASPSLERRWGCDPACGRGSKKIRSLTAPGAFVVAAYPAIISPLHPPADGAAQGTGKFLCVFSREPESSNRPSHGHKLSPDNTELSVKRSLSQQQDRPALASLPLSKHTPALCCVFFQVTLDPACRSECPSLNPPTLLRSPGVTVYSARGRRMVGAPQRSYSSSDQPDSKRSGELLIQGDFFSLLESCPFNCSEPLTVTG